MDDASNETLPREQAIAVDWRTPGGLSPEEVETVTRWYAENHGEGDLSGAPFVDFWLRHDTETMKRWRRMAASALSGSLTSKVPVCLFLHAYGVMGWEKGAVYEIISALKWGVTRHQVIEILSLAFIHGGPRGISNIAAGCSDYLARWDGRTEPQAPEWPKGWAADPQTFRSGIDFSKDGLTAGETEALCAWYRQNHGEVPSFVPFLAKHKPELLKSLRHRYESATRVVPKQLVPLMMFQTAAMEGRGPAMRRLAYQARRYGVLRNEIVSVASLAGLYSGELGLELISDTLEPLLAEWDDA